MSQDVKPTRSEELRLKEKIGLAESGHSVLEKKRDNLIHELMDLIPKLKDLEERVCKTYSDALNSSDLAKAFDGVDRLYSLTEKVGETYAEIDSNNIMGTSVPKVEISSEKTVFNPLNVSSRVLKTKKNFEELLELIRRKAELETSILNLVDEIESTKRRVNALEHKVIPEFKEALNYVSQKLEEDQRESTFRIKKFKEMQ